MLHPSYAELIQALNSDVVEGEQPVVNSRYSVVLATAKRARQLINGSDPLCDKIPCNKPLSIAVEEVYEGKVKIIGDEEQDA